MRTLCVVLLVFLAVITAVSALAHSDPHTATPKPFSPSSLTTGKSTTTTARFLRRGDAADEVDNENMNDEERAGFPGVSKIAGIPSKINEFIEKFAYKFAYKLLLKMKANPADIFKKLRLGEAGMKLDDNQAFIQWLKYVEAYRVKRGDDYFFSDGRVFALLRDTIPEEDLMPLFLSLRRVRGMEQRADEMQRYTLLTFPSTSTRLNEKWLQARETPETAFKILNIPEGMSSGNPFLLQWLRYTEMYRATMGKTSFSELQTYRMLTKADSHLMDENLAVLFQALKEVPDLERLAQNMQSILFQNFIRMRVKPKHFAGLLASNLQWTNIFAVAKTNPRYKAVEAYTLRYVEVRSGEAAAKRVKTLFADHDPTELARMMAAY